MKYLLFSTLVASALAGAAQTPAIRIGSEAPKGAPVERIERRSLHKFSSATANFPLDFTTEGNDALKPETVFGFNTDMQGWKADATSYVTWSIKADKGDDKSYSSIDPTSTGSLFVEGPYQTFRREISSIVSPQTSIPANGTLTFHVGYSLNYDDACRLVLSVSVAGSDEWTEIWNSKDGEGEKSWAWRGVNINLEQYAGKEVSFKFTYGPGSSDEMFNLGGYLGDFLIDGFTISGRQTVEHVDVMTGDKITFMPLTDVEIVSAEWNFPGGTPSQSNEIKPTVYYTTDGDYDISLTVTDKAGNTTTRTRTAFVSVTGTAPVATIIPPATFRLNNNRKPLIAPLAPVTYRDGSTGFPAEVTWAFSGVESDASKTFVSTESNPTVSYAYLHDQTVSLFAQNSHGISQAECDVTVEYSGVVNNLHPTDRMSTFDMEDWGVFPGSNTRNITAYAERFSAPSVPVRISGAYVFFNEASAEDLVDQISNIGVHLYTSKDGKPDQRLDSWWWQTFELDLPQNGQAVGTSFPFTDAPFVNDEFFIVVDGIPTYKEGTKVSFGMASFRDHSGTALMLKDGEWIEVADYFPAGANHTSYMIYPVIDHSVMAFLDPADGQAAVGRVAGSADFQIFSYMGYETPESDCDWLRVTSEPNGMTVDTLTVAYDALPASMSERTGHISLTDGASELLLTVHQQASTAVDRIESDMDEEFVEYYTLQGLRIDNPSPGQVVIRRTATKSEKIRY